MSAAALPKAIGKALEHVGERFEQELDEWLQAQGWAWQALVRGDYGFPLEHALLVFVNEDPVRWCETYLIEPDTGDPYRFFGYQIESMRAFAQNTIHEDGAEVGKTREIVCLLAWGSCTAMGGRVANPWSLVGAPQQTHLDEIILALEEQFGVSETELQRANFLRSFWTKPKRTPHTMHRIIAPNPHRPDRPSVARIYYRPGGVDGEAFRGVHVNAFGFMDEAAKLKRKEHWSEFMRALKPGCRLRVYSVPDGDRSSEFYRMCQSAIPNLAPERDGFRKFHWPKTLMPEPFWSAERERVFVERFGGRDTPGYKRNVLGEWGDAENPVFRWEDIRPNVVDVPEYRLVELICEKGKGQITVAVKSIALVRGDHGEKAGDVRWLTDASIDLAPFLGNDASRRAAIRELVRDALPAPSRGAAVYWAGADLGESNDPTALIVSEQRGRVLRDVLRVRAKGFSYDLQCELIDALDDHFARRAFWGVDLGNAGTAVVKDLQSLDRYAEGDFAVRLTGYHFAHSVRCIDEDGNALYEHDANGETVYDANGEAKVQTTPAKHWATQMVVARLQRAEYEAPFDAPVIDSMTSHTAREGARHRLYAKVNDHDIDARRQQMLRKLYNEDALVLDVFSSGTYDRRVA